MCKNTQIERLIHSLFLIKQRKASEITLNRNAVIALLRVLHLVMHKKTSKIRLTPKATQELLTSLREARENLVSRTLNEDPQLFESLFKYENNENLLSLSFEREFSIFINDNLERFSNNVTDIEDEGTKHKLKIITEEFVSFKQSKTTSFIDSFFLDDKVKQIEKIFSIFDKEKNRFQEVNYMISKDQVIFEREFNRLLGEQNGLAK
ncbi:hypothetical protein AN401_17180 [Zobellella denitrificans]|uniref:Uncharacterized protein n=1 Tax=Zobellella denitrificans TaxID=347534 RepID=A0A291HTE5_9GAMM|nr:hypothetical protein [Zobellella denitrificans]ATG75369.1 hypothetical protein AN401_17180 [Zobellella denitrificans]